MNAMPAIAWKICGMRDAANIMEVAELQPDYMGFIFYEASPRFVGNQFDIPDLPSRINRVGVFVNESLGRVQDLIQQHRLDFVQLHGDESVAYAKELKSKVGVIKVFRIDENFDFNSTVEFEHVADFFLFDTRGKHYGGNAMRFDWSLLKNYSGSVPFFLSGGISKSNIQELKNFQHEKLYALDINSGVEEKPGYKSVAKITDLQKSLNEIGLKH